MTLPKILQVSVYRYNPDVNSAPFMQDFNVTIDGKDNAVTPIIKDKTVPIPTPFKNKASAIGNVPNISAYIGMPTTVAIITAKGLSVPMIFSIIDCGIKL